MPDFEKLRAQRTTRRSPIPRDIFNRLVKPDYMRDLLPGQVEILDRWWEQRNERDVIIKQNTGGGKTLIGLLIAESTMVERNGNVVYLCPNKQLVSQTIAKATEVGLKAVPYQAGENFPSDFLRGKAVLVGSYAALFNGHSRFGVLGGTRYEHVSALILDDAHVELSSLRDAFTLTIAGDKPSTKKTYERLLDMFKPIFEDIGRGGTFESIAEGKEYSVLEVPYWRWKEISAEVSSIVRSLDALEWPLIRDNLDNCHCLISRKNVSLVPIFPSVDLLPTFANAPRRVFMSATIADDSVLAATFGLGKDVLTRAIESESLASVGERMILVPGFKEEFSEDEIDAATREQLALAKAHDFGSVVLAPSFESAKSWNDIAPVVSGDDSIDGTIQNMQDGDDRGPYTFANRYDGIDLRGDACRLLVMAGRPQGRSDYETYRGSCLLTSSEVIASQAQRIEQGIGRGSRGAGDWCAVILYGSDLVDWISREENWRYMTASTRAQIEIGDVMSKDTSDISDFNATVIKCFSRDRSWVEYHQEELIDRIEAEGKPIQSDSPMLAERKAYENASRAQFEEAARLLETETQSGSMARDYRAWFLQMAARYVWYAGDKSEAIRLQKEAYSLNRNLFRPPVAEEPYLSLPGPEFDQAKEMLRRVDAYRRPAVYAKKVALALRPLGDQNASNTKFEQALLELGEALGFTAERPDAGRRPRKGPDDLWLAHSMEAFVIEAKSEKYPDSPLSKDDHGQLLQSIVWFEKNYPGWSYTPVVVLHDAIVTESVDIGSALALTQSALVSLIDDTNGALNKIVGLSRTSATRAIEAKAIIDRFKLTPKDIRDRLVGFSAVKDRPPKPIKMPL